MTELKIDPKFRDLIPKLTDDEFAQLEKNILADGRVKEPIVTWNGIIIDGHHRYYIVQKHPEIPYEIEERDFPNEYAAMAWACSNQLGRRNLNALQRDYLIGKRQENEQLGQFNEHDEKGRFSPECTSGTSGKRKNDTASRIAREEGIGRRTVFKDENLAKGLDIADEIVTGLKDNILNQNIEVPKDLIRKLPKVTADKQRKAALAISNCDIDSAKQILDFDGTKKIVGLHDADETIDYTIDDLIQEIRENFKQYMTNIQSTLEDHPDVLSQPDCKQMVVFELSRIFNEQKEKIWRI